MNSLVIKRKIWETAILASLNDEYLNDKWWKKTYSGNLI